MYRHVGGAQAGEQRQSLGGVARQAKFFAGVDHRFHQVEEVGRATAGDRGDGVDQLFLIQPDTDADRVEDAFGLLTLLVADRGVGIQAADALAAQRRRIGHAADDGGTGAEPVFQAAAGDAGGDGNDQLAGLAAARQGAADVLHDLRLDRQQQDVALGCQHRVIGGRADMELALQGRALLGLGVAGDQVCRLDVLLQHAADQAGGHVAGADESDYGCSHRETSFSMR